MKVENVVDKCLFIGKVAREMAVKIGQISHTVLSTASNSSTTETYITSRLLLKQMGRKSSSLSPLDETLNDTRLLRSQNQLLEIYYMSHQLWAVSICDTFENHFYTGLKTEDWKFGSNIFNAWETVALVEAEIEGIEDDKSGASSSSRASEKLMLPVHCSIFILNVLRCVIDEINRANAYSLNKVKVFHVFHIWRFKKHL